MSTTQIPLADMIGCQFRDCNWPANMTFTFQHTPDSPPWDARAVCWQHLGMSIMDAHEAVVRAIPGQSLTETMLAENADVLSRVRA